MEQLFLWILNMSITAGYCALAVMVLRLLLKKQPKAYSYALWLIVAFRLLCPVSFESVFSLMRISPEAIPQDIAMQHVPKVTTGIGGVDVVVNQVLSYATPDVVVSVNPLQIWQFVGSIVWLLVAAGFFGYGVGSYLKMRMELNGATETEPGVFVSERLKTPFVLGLLKPVIYLPDGLTDVEKAYVLEHERTHIGRGDHIVKMGAFLLLCLHWFNPLLWVSYFMMCKDMEMSCDEKVIKKLSADHAVETKKDYASTLLSLASNHQFSFGGPLAFGEGNIKKRIANVLQYKKRTVAVSAVLAVVVIAVIFLFVGNPKKEKESGEVPEITVTPTPTGLQAILTPVVTSKPELVVDTSGMELLKEENGVRTYYGVVDKMLTETGYFTLNVPEVCVDEVCYFLELSEQEDGSYAVQDIQFYLTEQMSPEARKKTLQGSGTENVQLLDEYFWIDLKSYLKEKKEGQFFSALQRCVIVNEEKTGGYLHNFPLDNVLEIGTPAFEAYETAGRAFDIRTQLTIHIAPQTVYTEEELLQYESWKEDSLGTKLKENVYYGDITGEWLVTPYFELWVRKACVGKVSYFLTLKEKEDGTKYVSGLQFLYAPGTIVKQDVTKASYLYEYFKEFCWFGGVSWSTLADYDDAPEELLLDWVKRAGSIKIQDIEPYYLQEVAPVGRDIYWVNEAGTGAYFYHHPSDVQWRAEYEEEYFEIQKELNHVEITFYAEPEVNIPAELMQKLRESAGLN